MKGDDRVTVPKEHLRRGRKQQRIPQVRNFRGRISLEVSRLTGDTITMTGISSTLGNSNKVPLKI